MIEIISILITLISLFIISNFPINLFYFEKKYGVINYSFSEVLLLNLIINCNIFLIISFFSVNFNLIFFLIAIYVLFFFIYFKKKYFALLQNNIFFCLSFIIFFYGVSILIAKNGYLEYDALAHWIFKVKVFFQGGNVSDLKDLRVYNWYPHLGSYIWAFFWKNSFFQYEYLGRLFFIYIFLISIFSIKSKLNQNYTDLQKILIIFLLAFFSTNIFLFGGYQEYFLFFCFFCFSNFFIKFYNLEKKTYQILNPEIIILLILNIFLWVKQEGLFYFFILIFLYMLHSRKSYINKSIFFITSIFIFLTFLFLKVYYFGSFRFSDEIINPETFKNFDFNYLLFKIYIISKYFLISFIKYPIWLIIILSIVFLRTQSNFLIKNSFFYTYIFLMFALIYAIFLNIPEDITWLVPITLNRLVFGMSGFLIILCVEFINRLKLK